MSPPSNPALAPIRSGPESRLYVRVSSPRQEAGVGEGYEFGGHGGRVPAPDRAKRADKEMINPVTAPRAPIRMAEALTLMLNAITLPGGSKLYRFPASLA
jgi:hypothetical protein